MVVQRQWLSTTTAPCYVWFLRTCFVEVEEGDDFVVGDLLFSAEQVVCHLHVALYSAYYSTSTDVSHNTYVLIQYCSSIHNSSLPYLRIMAPGADQQIA